MAEEKDRPPTYEELLALRDTLAAENRSLKSKLVRLTKTGRQTAEELRARNKFSRGRTLDKGAKSALDRPWDGR